MAPGESCSGSWQEKSYEITAVAELLDALELDGAIVAADAIACQTKMAAKSRRSGLIMLSG